MAAIVNGELKVKKDWEIKKLGDICEFRRGLTYSKNDEVENSSNAVLRSNNIDLITNRLDLSEIKYISDKIKIDETKKVKRDSLLICTANGSKAHLGKVALIDDDYDFAFGGFMGLLIPSESVYPRFFYYALISENYKKFIKSLSDGANINNLKFQDLSKFEVPVPPREEQKRIVKILDEKIAQLETIKTNAQTNLQNAKDLFQSQLTKAFSNTTWEKKRLDEVCAITSKLVDPTLPEYLDLYHVGGANIESETGILLDLKTSKEEGLSSGKFTFDESMVLYNKIRPYLKKVARPDFAGLCSADMYPLNPKNNITKDYLYYILTSDDFTQYAISKSDRAGMPKVNREALFAYKCYLPPLPEQKHIVKELDTLSEKVKALQNIYEQMLLDCEELKQSFLCKAFAGEL